MSATYLKALVQAYLEAPPHSEDEQLLDKAIDIACARENVDATELVSTMVNDGFDCDECLDGTVVNDTCDECDERHCSKCEPCD